MSAGNPTHVVQRSGRRSGLRSGRRLWPVVAAALLTAAACVPASGGPGDGVSQMPPIAANGMAWEGDTLWVCDLFGGQLLNVDPDTGRVLRRIGPDSGISAPDDLVVLDDGTLITTSPTAGRVTRIPRLGAPTVLAEVAKGVNPITLAPDGGGVLIGYGSGERRSIDRVDLTTGVVTEVVSGLPEVNGFSIGPDGALWSPADGPLGGIRGDGRMLRIDLAGGTFSTVPVTFAGQPDKAGFAFGVSAKWSADGRLRVFEGFTGIIYDVAISDGPAGPTALATRLAAVPGGVADNQAWSDTGRFAASGFFGEVLEIGDTGTVRRII